MKNFEKSVPFDPGYSPISFSFTEQINYLTAPFVTAKAMHQKKFQFMQLEKKAIDLVNKATAFYLGCILWGGFIHFRFKDNPKPIEDNNTLELSKEEQENLDCAFEVKNILAFIELFERDCKYYLKRSANVPQKISEILNSYVEFSEINKNFLKIKTTEDIKIPKSISHFSKLDEKKLDKLCDKIFETIETKKIESLLDIGFYK